MVDRAKARGAGSIAVEAIERKATKGASVTDRRQAIRTRYAAAAGTAADPMMKDGGTCGITFYDRAEIEGIPAGAVEGSLGCANPVALADLRTGETVLDLGSGAGIDVLLSARRVAPGGKAYGLDMTDEMLALARENQRKAGVSNAEFLKGYIEDIPLPAAVIDVVVSNCVINLSPEKPAVFAEMFRVLRPAGRIAIADLIADEELDPTTRERLFVESPCLATALTRTAYQRALEDAGFDDVAISDSHEVTAGFTSAIARAVKREQTIHDDASQS
ncbi:MAG TPA: methyltransferase domain-containing protein [Actinomycetota bacterium]|nr:methyltransferase domain-containing protein [Actinomycetota bacterium]